MLVLHAAFRERSLVLWGESSIAGRVRAEAGVHPFSASYEQLADALESIGLKVPRVEAVSNEVLLPSLDAMPVRSSPLLGKEAQGKKAVALRPWWVETLSLRAPAALELLCLTTGKEMLETGVMAGADLAYWAAAMNFAGALVARQQFLPDLVREDGRFCARWRAVYLGRDDDRLHGLIAAMPHAARAITPGVSAAMLLTGFLDLFVDELIRSSSKAVQRSGPGLHDRWIEALHTPKAKVTGADEDLEAFEAQLRAWSRPLALSSAAPYRLCFRLEEPESDDRPLWRVRYFLQARRDPSLLIPAESVWKLKGMKPPVWAEGDFKWREHLLFSLGQAAAISPRVEESLRSATPIHHELDTNGAFEFLNTSAGALEEAGFGVMLPAWWSRKGTRARVSAGAHVKSPFQKGSELSLDELLQFEWQISIEGEEVSLRELRALAAMKAPLVRFRGQWVQMSAQEIQAALQFWKKDTGQITAREAVRIALGAARPPGSVEFTGVSAEGWIGDLIQRLEGHAPFEEVSVPEGLHAKLRPYQVRGYSWLAFVREWGLGACLADDMGLGKTIQTLSLIQRDRRAGEARPVLLVCPTSVVGNWQKEAARFTPELSVMVHHGVTRSRGDAFVKQASEHAMVVSSYSLLHRDFEHLKDVPWAGIVLDEAQNIKNPETKQAAAARSLNADYRIALTGTPVENNVGDLWSMMEFLNPGLLGTRSEFKRNFFVPIQSGRDPEAAVRLKKITGPFVLRRLKTDKSIIEDLPEKQEMKVFCILTKEQASLYAAVVKDSMDAIKSAEGMKRKGVVLATITRLKQICNHPAQLLRDNSPLQGRSGKLARLSEMVEEGMSVGDRVLIFSQFAEMGFMLQRHLEETFGRETLFLHGGVPKKQRDQMVERFQEEIDGPPVFILSLKAGGTGLNLTRANHVFHFDRWWNPAVENQATDRAFRLGQTKNVQVHKFVCAGTFEEKIDQMIEQKKEIAANVVGTGEGWLTELSTSQLKDLFALQRTAVAE